MAFHNAKVLSLLCPVPSLSVSHLLILGTLVCLGLRNRLGIPPYSQYIEFSSLGESLKTDELVISRLALMLIWILRIIFMLDTV